MGYILPIQNFGSSEYQKRITKDKQDPHIIEKPYKVILKMNQEEVDEKYRHHKFTVKKQYSSTINTGKEKEQLFDKLTGKGVFFNESI